MLSMRSEAVERAILASLPLEVLYETTRNRVFNYLISHDFGVSRTLFVLEKSALQDIVFCPVSLDITTTRGMVEPDIITAQNAEKSVVILPVIFEIVNSPHSTKCYFSDLFLKYYEISNNNKMLFAHLVFTEKAFARFPLIAESFKNTMEGIAPPSITKYGDAYLMSAKKTLYIKMWKLKNIEADPRIFNYVIDSEIRRALRKDLFLRALDYTPQHIKGAEVTENEVVILT